MQQYRFVGSEGTVGGRIFDAFGQIASFSEEQYLEVVRGRCPFVPEEDFSALGFTDEELKAFGPAGRQLRAPASFIERRDRARDIFREKFEEVTLG